jgi:hypothetical protein
MMAGAGVVSGIYILASTFTGVSSVAENGPPWIWRSSEDGPDANDGVRIPITRTERTRKLAKIRFRTSLPYA